MTQCFNDPDVIKVARPNDPEVAVFVQSLQQNPQAKILLDFGAGHGRVYREFVKDSELQKGFQYCALEPDPVLSAELREIGLAQVFTDYTLLPKDKFEFILLCNVLHEIKIDEWENTLNHLLDSLTDDGFLIIVEDKLMPKGEKIGEHGFLVLDLPSIRELFSMEENPTEILPPSQKHMERILCSAVRKSRAKRVTHETIIRSLRLLRETTIGNIRANRLKKITKENKLSLGREAAFYSQLYINSILAEEKVDELEKKQRQQAQN